MALEEILLAHGTVRWNVTAATAQPTSFRESQARVVTIPSDMLVTPCLFQEQISLSERQEARLVLRTVLWPQIYCSDRRLLKVSSTNLMGHQAVGFFRVW